jgi:outer membrane lipoprotein-sorting protein
MTHVRAFVVLIVLLVLAAPGTAQKDPPAVDILRAASQYLASYAPRISGVLLEEEYTLLDVSGGRVVMTRRINSDVVLLNPGGKIVGLRDPFSVDDNPLRERTPRITSLLAKPSEAAWARAQAYAGESVRYFQDELILRLNDPTLTLQFVAPENQSRVTYKVEGRKKIGGIETVVLKFQETKVKPLDYVLDTPGKAVASGKLWVEPATGRIHRTELSMQSDSESAHIIVDYAQNAALDLWLPSSMVDTYEAIERVGTGMSNMGAGTPGIARRAFDCRANYANARLTPIDMRVAK